MTERGKYIYGIINSNASLHLSIPTDFLVGRSESNGVYTIPYQDISALVRDSEIVEYTGMRKDALARLLVGHQTVIERIIAPGITIIPIKLGTFAQDETEIRDILSKGYNLIKEIFEKIKDRIEIDITATWGDLASIIKEAGEEKEIRELKEKLLSNPKGITTDDQMKIGFMLKKALDEKRAKFAKGIQDRLKAVSEDSRIHELMDDHMVINAAFLIYKAKHKDFEEKVEELNTTMLEKLNFRCVGPLPPYSFYTLEIKKLKFEEIDWAKKRLGILDDITSKDELKKAYRRQVFSTHPDKNPNEPCAEKEFDEVNKAYKIIADYCVALEQANDPLGENRKKNSPRGQIFRENAILVRIRE